MPMQQAAEAHRQLETGSVRQRIILTFSQRGRPDEAARPAGGRSCWLAVCRCKAGGR
jgi:hypothetical protein